MTDDLDTLRPEVREAWRRIVADAQRPEDFECVQAELLRLARENDEWQTRCLRFQTERDMARAELTLAHRERDRMFLDAREWATRFGEMEARAEKAEAELAALKDENAQLRDVLADRDMDREMAAHANKELAALKARIADSRTTDVFESEGHAGMVAMGGLPCEWIGKNVRLVVEE